MGGLVTSASSIDTLNSTIIDNLQQQRFAVRLDRCSCYVVKSAVARVTMPDPRQVSGQEAIRALERLGFVQVRQKGSHVVLKRQTPEGEIGCVVPLHRELALGTLRGILKQARVTPEELANSL
jgi:predicted RNA binding protein YcfA (HicA-like mRNA interferase family)